MPGTTADGVYYNTDSGLAAPGGFLDRLIGTVDQVSQNQAQMRGLAPALQATGIPVQAPSPGILSRALGGMGLAMPAMPAAARPADPAPQAAAALTVGANGLAQLVGSTAQKYNIDPTTAVRVAMSEGGRMGGYGPGGVGDNGTSFGPFQLHVGGGMGDDFTKATGLDPSDPKNLAATVDYALMRASKEGWSAFHGAARSGIGAFQGIGGGQPTSAMAYAGPQPQAQPAGGAQGAITKAAVVGPLARQDSAAAAPPAQQVAAVPGDAPQTAAIPAGAASSPFQQGGSMSQLPGGLTPAAIGAMIQEPATRAQGLALWQQMLSPKAITSVEPGRAVFANGRYVGTTPAAPMTVPQGDSVYDPSSHRQVFQAAPKLDLKQIGVDPFGNPSYGSFDPATGAVAPVGQAAAAGGQNPVTGNYLKSIGLDTSKTGEEFLAQIDPTLANTVRAIVSGREPAPSGRERNQGMGRMLTALVNQADPQFESSNGPTRNAVYQAYSDPDKPVGAAINAGNSAVAHLGELAEKGEALSSGQFPLINGVTNVIGKELGGNTAYTDYNNVLGKYVEEVTKFYRGTGGTESDLARDMANLSPNMSPAQRRSALASQAALIQGKVGALQSQYQHAMGPMAQPFPILQPHSQQVLSTIIGRVPGAQPGGAPAPSPVPGPQGASPQTPDPAAAVSQAKAAIAAGADRGKVILRMKSMNLPTDGL